MLKYIYKNKFKEVFDMENEDNILKSYYEITYLDDNKNTHLGRVYNIDELNFIKERFEVKNCNFVSMTDCKLF